MSLADELGTGEGVGDETAADGPSRRTMVLDGAARPTSGTSTSSKSSEISRSAPDKVSEENGKELSSKETS